MFYLTKIFHFEAAHALNGYDGKCRNIHGHSYELRVTVKGMPLNEPGNPKNGMVIDFHDLKQIVNQEVVDKLDHAFIIGNNMPKDFQIPPMPIISSVPPMTNMPCFFPFPFGMTMQNK